MSDQLREALERWVEWMGREFPNARSERGGVTEELHSILTQARAALASVSDSQAEEVREAIEKAAHEVVAALCELAEEERWADQGLADRLWEIAHVLEIPLGLPALLVGNSGAAVPEGEPSRVLCSGGCEIPACALVAGKWYCLHHLRDLAESLSQAGAVAEGEPYEAMEAADVYSVRCAPPRGSLPVEDDGRKER